MVRQRTAPTTKPTIDSLLIPSLLESSRSTHKVLTTLNQKHDTLMNDNNTPRSSTSAEQE